MQRFASCQCFVPLFMSGALVLGACGGGDPVILADPATFPAFSNYCVGTLLVETQVLRASPPGSWMSFTPERTTPAGGEFFVGADFGEWQGWGMTTDGSPVQLHASGGNSLQRDTDFSAACAEDVKLAYGQAHSVLLAPATFHAAADLSGAACRLETGTELTSFSYVGGVPGATVTAAEITSTCGYAIGHSGDITWGELVLAAAVAP